MTFSNEWSKLDDYTFTPMSADAGLDVLSNPTIVNIINSIPSSSIVVTESHKTYIFTITATAGGSTLTFPVHRLINPCPTATLLQPYPLPVNNYIRTGTDEIN